MSLSLNDSYIFGGASQMTRDTTTSRSAIAIIATIFIINIDKIND